MKQKWIDVKSLRRKAFDGVLQESIGLITINRWDVNHLHVMFGCQHFKIALNKLEKVIADHKQYHGLITKHKGAAKYRYATAAIYRYTT